ncbi:TRAP transporter substrate-binding protein [Alcaligenes faecalis]|uniref:TRAP transporter substrate-binding protein n=2 Tax=Alcaligenes TaxID=507 RepID=A0ABY7N8A8_ALCFA|nr:MULTISPECIES: TRAP transporter substrate-binding protein [Alcaligenes]MBX6964805.1 C4-dicarboxylate ABC transporter substrate-binding protein [Providencia rettgeri]ALO38520.1 C4-dicarboxylate ABC transporter substrate-binding protein [Alcaligenes faecalis]ATI01609.1 C4-dicarboxylate ABC transporter substrate-binding protein [Alcaligenes faecalis]AYZ90965.1 C4-dicarboxylate ABC transporter substrate-binding protein [Alcaligenes faecalis]KAA1285145.1 C4-dicarboxylate ABC transporter substrate
MIKKLLSMACVLALAGTAQAATNWNMSTEQPDNNFLTQNAREFAADIKAATNGELNINVQSNSVLLKRPEVKRGVQQGVVQAGEMLVAAIGNEDPLFEVDSVPFLASSFDQSEKLWKATRPFLAERLDKQGIVLVYGSPWPPQGIYTKKPVEQLSDLAGVRFRAYSPATSRLVSLMGAVPTTVQTPEVPQAFSTGIIDAMLTSPATGVDSQAWDYVKYYYDAQVFIPQSFVIINKRAFQRLPENVQKAVLEAGERAEQRGWAMSREQTSKLTQTMADKGMVVGQLSEKLAGELHAIGQTMTEEWLKKAGADGQKLLDTYRQP